MYYTAGPATVLKDPHVLCKNQLEGHLALVPFLWETIEWRSEPPAL